MERYQRAQLSSRITLCEQNIAELEKAIERKSEKITKDMTLSSNVLDSIILEIRELRGKLESEQIKKNKLCRDLEEEKGAIDAPSVKGNGGHLSCPEKDAGSTIQ